MRYQKANERQLFELANEDAGLGWIADNILTLNTLMDCVRRGDTEEMEHLISEETLELEIRFSEDPLRHSKNLVIILIQMLAIAAMDSGLSRAISLRLEEQYIRQLENERNPKRIASLADQVKMEFCRRVQEQQTPLVSDMRLKNVISYINSNCVRKITLKELSDLMGVSREHFSRLFKKETGLTVSEYLRKRRILIAMQMLERTDESLSEISSYLAFSSQAYFQKVFREETGLTPLSYRKNPSKKARISS